MMTHSVSILWCENANFQNRFYMSTRRAILGNLMIKELTFLFNFQHAMQKESNLLVKM